jgi:hypothetical protein
MVCAKCSKLSKTTLVTPGVKKRSEMYYGSAASSSSAGDKKSATLGQTGVSKASSSHKCSASVPVLTLQQSKLLSKNAKNPFAQYSR